MKRTLLVLLVLAAAAVLAALAVGAALASGTCDNNPVAAWRRPPPDVRGLGHYGCVVWDPDANLWRQFLARQQTKYRACQQTSTDGVLWGDQTVALDLGTAGQWDDDEIEVPFVWYEAGEARPWRMMYRGRRSAGLAQIGLATSVDGLTWERKDTAGNALTAPVLAPGTGADWDADSIDHGTVIKHGSTYYFYYNTVSRAAPELVVDRQTGVATSTDLVTWTKDAAHNPLFSGGIFCVDVVRWDKPDGTARWVMFAPHHTLEGSPSLAHLEVWSSTSPLFYAANRTYEGVAFVSAGAYTEGVAIAAFGIDVPHIVVENPERNVLLSTVTGDEWWMSVTTSARNERQEIWRRHKTTPSHVLTDVDGPDAVSPAYRLKLYQNDAHTKFLFAPAAAGTLNDLSGYGTHVRSIGPTATDANGVTLVSANAEILTYHPTALAALNDITGDFTIEWRTSFVGVPAGDNRYLLAYSDGTDTHFYVYAYIHATEPANCYWYLFCKTGGGNLAKNTPKVVGGATGVHRWAVVRSGAKLYWFMDGALLNAGGTDCLADALSTTPANAALYIGAGPGGTPAWDGTVDEIRFSDSARWTANYTPAAPTLVRKASGAIFSAVFDLGTDTAADLAPVAATTPDGCTVAVLYRAADGLTDTSADAGDFAGALPAGERYVQYAVTLAADGSTTPLIETSALDYATLPDVSVGAGKTLTLTAGQSYSLGTVGTGTGTIGLGASRVTLRGDVTHKGTLDLGRACVVAGAAITLSGDGVTVLNTSADVFSNGAGNTLTVENLPTVSPPLRAWCGVTDGGMTGGVTFHPGPPSGGCLMGCGN